MDSPKPADTLQRIWDSLTLPTNANMDLYEDWCMRRKTEIIKAIHQAMPLPPSDMDEIADELFIITRTVKGDDRKSAKFHLDNLENRKEIHAQFREVATRFIAYIHTLHKESDEEAAKRYWEIQRSMSGIGQEWESVDKGIRDFTIEAMSRLLSIPHSPSLPDIEMVLRQMRIAANEKLENSKNRPMSESAIEVRTVIQVVDEVIKAFHK